MSKIKEKFAKLPWDKILEALNKAWEVAPEVWAAFKKEGEKLPWRKHVIKIVTASNDEIVLLKETVIRQDARIEQLEKLVSAPLQDSKSSEKTK